MLRESVVTLLRVRWSLRGERDLDELFRRWEASAAVPRGGRRRRPEDIARTVESVQRIVGPRHDGCVPRAIAQYIICRRHGHPARFASGVLMANGRVTGHAWVTVHGVPVSPHDRRSPAVFRELFSYPRHMRSDQRASAPRSRCQ